MASVKSQPTSEAVQLPISQPRHQRGRFTRAMHPGQQDADEQGDAEADDERTEPPTRQWPDHLAEGDRDAGAHQDLTRKPQPEGEGHSFTHSGFRHRRCARVTSLTRMSSRTSLGMPPSGVIDALVVSSRRFCCSVSSTSGGDPACSRRRSSWEVRLYQLDPTRTWDRLT